MYNFIYITYVVLLTTAVAKYIVILYLEILHLLKVKNDRSCENRY